MRKSIKTFAAFLAVLTVIGTLAAFYVSADTTSDMQDYEKVSYQINEFEKALFTVNSSGYSVETALNSRQFKTFMDQNVKIHEGLTAGTYLKDCTDTDGVLHSAEEYVCAEDDYDAQADRYYNSAKNSSDYLKNMISEYKLCTDMESKIKFYYSNYDEMIENVKYLSWFVQITFTDTTDIFELTFADLLVSLDVCTDRKDAQNFGNKMGDVVITAKEAIASEDMKPIAYTGTLDDFAKDMASKIANPPVPTEAPTEEPTQAQDVYSFGQFYGRITLTDPFKLELSFEIFKNGVALENFDEVNPTVWMDYYVSGKKIIELSLECSKAVVNGKTYVTATTPSFNISNLNNSEYKFTPAVNLSGKEPVNGDQITFNMYDCVNHLKNDETFSLVERETYAAMADYFDAMTAYQDSRTSTETYTRYSGSVKDITFSSQSKYDFELWGQIYLGNFEEGSIDTYWGAQLSTKVIDKSTGQVIPAAQFDERGVIVYCDTESDELCDYTPSDIISKSEPEAMRYYSDAFNVLDNTLAVTNFCNISTYQLKKYVYIVPYVMKDGEYFLDENVSVLNIYDTMNQLLLSDDVPQVEKDTYKAMIGYCDKILAYRNEIQ